MRGTALIGAVILATTVLGAGSAAADAPAGTADLGSAHFTRSGTTIDVPALAPCAVDATASAASGPVVRPGVSFGGGTSSCTRTVVDPNADTTATTSTLRGQNFELSALVGTGGPRIKLAQYQLTCTGEQNRTSANWSFGGLSGMAALPSPVPANYTRPITRADGTLLATAVFNAVSQPGDGSTSVTLLTITFAPASGLVGSVTLGEVACSVTP